MAAKRITRGERPPGILQCLGLLIAISGSLRLRGFAHTVRRINRMPFRSGNTDHVNDQQLADAGVMARQVATAAAVLPFRAMCLEQSCVLYLLCRRSGLPAVLRLGVTHHGFTAHAWVELGGMPINEREDLIKSLRAFPQLPL